MGGESGQTLSRQWVMLQAIPRSPRKATAADLESRLRDEGFAVSRRTLERDLQALSARFPLELDDRSKPYGWSWAKNAQFEFLPKLTSPQAIALLLARTHLRDLLPQPMNAELTPIFDAATQALSGSGWKDWHKCTAVVPMGIPHIPPELSDSVLITVQSALARRRCLEVSYRPKGAGQAKTYKAHPLGLLSRGPVLYLICTLFDCGDVVQLALHRMRSATETGEHAKAPKNFDFQRYAKTEARRFDSRGTIKLVARFDAGSAEHLREMPISKDQKLRDIEDGQVEVTATVEDDELLRWWLLGFGSKVEVINPLKLRDWLFNEAESLVKNYVGKQSP